MRKAFDEQQVNCLEIGQDNPRQSLKAAHQRLLEAIMHLEVCTDADVPSLGPVLTARMRLIQAEGHRRTTVQLIIRDLAASGSAPVGAALSDHQQMRTELDRFRTSYVRSWTPETMQADWKGYRAARTEKCRKLRESIEQEQLLFRRLL